MKLKTLFTGTLALLAMGGCVAPTPYFDHQFGMAVNTAKARQTLNPDASLNPDPVAGLDGISSDSAVDEYHNSFKAPPPTFPVINIGVGGGGR
jgi:hypothetical protein